MLKPWHIQFINKLKEGETESNALTLLKVARATYEKEYEENEDFQNAIALAKTGYSGTQLDSASLRHVLEAQVNDEMAAAYFGMKTQTFMETISSSPELKLAYETGRESGKAKMLVAAYATGLGGDSAMQKHFLAFHNNMVEKKDTPPPLQINIVSTIEEAAQKLAFLNQANNIISQSKSNVIEGTCEEIPYNNEDELTEELIIDSEDEILDNEDTNLTKEIEYND